MDKIDAQYRALAVKNLKGVGDRIADKLNHLGLFTLFDLLFNLPFRYLDKTKIYPLSELQADGNAHLVKLEVVASGFKGQRAKVFLVSARDDSGYIELLFFNIQHYFAQNFTPGKHFLAFGALKHDSYSGALTMAHPEVTFLKADRVQKHLRPTLSPIYHLTDKLAQKNMGKIEHAALALLNAMPLTELIPPHLLPEGLQFSLTDAILTCHYPKPRPDGHLPLPETLPQFARICLEELTAYMCAMRRLKDEQQVKQAIAIPYDPKLQQDFLRTLPYKPTNAQNRVFAEVAADMEKSLPMLRLINGDVGSGKTLVAMMAALQAVKAGVQCVLLAPTEILAHQHYDKCVAQLGPLGVNCVLLGSKQNAAQKRSIQAAIQDGSAQLIIGTHAVFQEKVTYHRLGLVIIDEQHRFGVAQRAALTRKAPDGTTPHQLTLSATPIPRTLQLTMCADLAVSRLDEIPPGRTPIITACVSKASTAQAIERLRFNLDKGVQAYWVCPLIDDSEIAGVNSVTQAFELLSTHLPHCTMGVLHGQQSAEKKNAVMEDFASGRIQLLIATTIIEVGVDVPNATIMVIDNAERLGLAQLHQLRGRVGRGHKQSFCLLIYDDKTITPTAQERLKIMRQSNDGFAIATADLKLRGPGDLTGTQQAGFDTFRIANVARDWELLEKARTIADTLWQEERAVGENLIARWFPENNHNRLQES